MLLCLVRLCHCSSLRTRHVSTCNSILTFPTCTSIWMFYTSMFFRLVTLCHCSLPRNHHVSTSWISMFPLALQFEGFPPQWFLVSLRFAFRPCSSHTTHPPWRSSLLKCHGFHLNTFLSYHTSPLPFHFYALLCFSCAPRYAGATHVCTS